MCRQRRLLVIMYCVHYVLSSIGPFCTQCAHTCSILCICYVALVMTIKTSMAWVNFNAGNTNDTIQNPIPDPHQVQVWPNGFSGLLTVISYCSLAFVCQFNLLPLQKELHNPTKRRLNIIIISSIVIAYVLYNIVIFMGYFNVSAITCT